MARSPDTAPGAGAPAAALAQSRRRLAGRLAGLRKARDWTLDQAAARTGVSRASLSKLEKGQMSPTFDVLSRIALGFGLSPVALLGGQGREPTASRRAIDRAGDGEMRENATYRYRMLATELSHKALLPFVTAVKARALEDFADWDRHESEDFLYVLEGALTLYTEHYEPARLEAGDSAYIDGRMGHALVSESEADAVILWVSAP